MPSKSRARDILEFAALFFLLYLLTQFALRHFFPQQFGVENGSTGVVFQMQDATVKGGHHPVAVINNYTESPVILEDRCPLPPFEVSRKEGDEFVQMEAEEIVLPCVPLGQVEPGAKVVYELAPWKYSLFSKNGTYRLTLPSVLDAEGKVIATEFTISPPGSITKMFRAFITKPFLNLLILIASYMPGKSLALAIIILTLLVKLILFIPTQHGLEGQRKLQALQPKIDALKQKYKDEPQRVQQETMKLWKEYKVNPFQSCLPILIQFPILIGLFYVIRDGSILELSRHLLYGPNQELSWTFGTNFFGMDLTQPSKLFFPPLLVIMQFAQMKLSFAIAKKKKGKDVDKKPESSQQQTQQKVMLYGLPLMIGFFALQFPTAVSLYWGVSTLFAIGQQLVVNRKEL